MGSSFCRLSRVKLQNEDPRLKAETHDATRRRDRLLQQIASCDMWNKAGSNYKTKILA